MLAKMGHGFIPDFLPIFHTNTEKNYPLFHNDLQVRGKCTLGR